MLYPNEIIAELGKRMASSSDMLLEPWLKEVFMKHDYHPDWSGLDEKKRNQLNELGFFYYHIASPYHEDDEDVRDELRIVVITSLMEAIMSTEPYEDFMSWLSKEIRDTISKSELDSLKEKYLKQYGLTRKVREFINKYFLPADKAAILESLEVFDKAKRDWKPIKNLDEFTNILYTIRSEFVHSAQMGGFCSTNAHRALTTVGNDHISTSLTIVQIMDAFERSFINYCKTLLVA